ncbi:hypothetical protein HaLaN_25591, partial [Haematococcus lacustris]
MAYTWHTHGHGRLPPTALPDPFKWRGAHTTVPQQAAAAGPSKEHFQKALQTPQRRLHTISPPNNVGTYIYFEVHCTCDNLIRTRQRMTGHIELAWLKMGTGQGMSRALDMFKPDPQRGARAKARKQEATKRGTLRSRRPRRNMADKQ